MQRFKRTIGIAALSLPMVACTTIPPVDRSAWEHISVPIGWDKPPPHLICHDGKSRIVKPRVNEPAKLWVKVPLTTEARAALTSCGSRVIGDSDHEQQFRAVGDCMRKLGIPVEEKSMAVHAPQLACS